MEDIGNPDKRVHLLCPNQRHAHILLKYTLHINIIQRNFIYVNVHRNQNRPFLFPEYSWHPTINWRIHTTKIKSRDLKAHKVGPEREVKVLKRLEAGTLFQNKFSRRTVTHSFTGEALNLRIMEPVPYPHFKSKNIFNNASQRYLKNINILENGLFFFLLQYN